MRFITLALVLLFTTAGCLSDRPSDVVSEETYIDLMVELQLLQSYREYTSVDSASTDSLRHVIFNAYGVTEQAFERSHQYYQDHDVREQRDRIGKAVEALRKDRLAGQDSVGTREEPD